MGQQHSEGTGSCRGAFFLPTRPNLRMDTQTRRGGRTQQTGRVSGAGAGVHLAAHRPVFHGIPQPTGSWEGRGQRDKLLGWGRSPVFIERPPKPHGAGHHSSIPSSPWGRCQQPQAGCGDTLVPEQPGTYIDLTEDDIDDAADHDEEVKDVPGVPEVALQGESQREEG